MSEKGHFPTSTWIAIRIRCRPFFKISILTRYYSCITSPLCYRSQWALILGERKKTFSFVPSCGPWTQGLCDRTVLQGLSGSAEVGTQQCWGSAVLCEILQLLLLKGIPEDVFLEEHPHSNASTNTENRSSDSHLISCAQTSSSLMCSSTLPCSPCSCKLWYQGQRKWA